MSIRETVEAMIRRLLRERDEASAEVERLKAEAAEARFESLLAKKRVASYQREACAAVLYAAGGPYCAWGDRIRATPLVTDEVTP